jgi:hypothetical protein
VRRVLALALILPLLASAQVTSPNGATYVPGGSGSLPSCTTNQSLYYASSGTTGSCLTYGSGLTVSSGTLSASGGSPAFSAITTGSNTTATMTVSTGASIVTAGSGSITATATNGYATASLPTCNSGAEGEIAYTTDGTASPVFCNGTSWVGSGGTTFTISATGCTPSAHAGSATAGTITLASGPCTSIVITPNGAVGMTAPNGFHCNVGDRTTQNAGTWIPEWGESASSTTTATIPIPSAAGATDVISFDCTPY